MSSNEVRKPGGAEDAPDKPNGADSLKEAEKRPALSPDEPAETLPLGTGALAHLNGSMDAASPPVAPPPAGSPVAPKAPPMVPSTKVAAAGLPQDESLAKAPPPPSSPSAAGPKAPPMAPAGGGALPRAPAPSEVILAPKAPPMAPTASPMTPAPPPMTPAPPPMAPAPPPMAPAPPPTAPGAKDAEGLLSAPAQQLMDDIAGVAPVYSSFEFSQRLPDYVARYWSQRREVLMQNPSGEVAQDYEAILALAKAAHDEDDNLDRDAVLDRIRDIADELDGDKLSYFAPGLRGKELRILQAVHDLSLALIHYKLAVRLDSASDRLVMVTSSTGAQGCLDQARQRFAGMPVPEAIHNYARLLELKLSLEEENCRQLLGG